jgi:hypothetical protein
MIYLTGDGASSAMGKSYAPGYSARAHGSGSEEGIKRQREKPRFWWCIYIYSALVEAIMAMADDASSLCCRAPSGS